MGADVAAVVQNRPGGSFVSQGTSLRAGRAEQPVADSWSDPRWFEVARRAVDAFEVS
jgi:hypothetical protein